MALTTYRFGFNNGSGYGDYDDDAELWYCRMTADGIPPQHPQPGHLDREAAKANITSGFWRLIDPALRLTEGL